MPRFDLLEPDRYNRLTVQTQRGCPFHCDFCAASTRLRPGYRTKPIPKVLAEIEEIRRIWDQPFLTPFPGTPLYDRLLAAGRILEPGAWERCTLFDINFVPELMTVEELDVGFRDLMRRIYADDFVHERRRSFFGELRAARKVVSA